LSACRAIVVRKSAMVHCTDASRSAPAVFRQRRAIHPRADAFGPCQRHRNRPRTVIPASGGEPIENGRVRSPLGHLWHKPRESLRRAEILMRHRFVWPEGPTFPSPGRRPGKRAETRRKAPTGRSSLNDRSLPAGHRRTPRWGLHPLIHPCTQAFGLGWGRSALRAKRLAARRLATHRAHPRFHKPRWLRLRRAAPSAADSGSDPPYCSTSRHCRSLPHDD
jgi:hypothetical protein